MPTKKEIPQKLVKYIYHLIEIASLFVEGQKNSEVMVIILRLLLLAGT